MSYRWNTLFPPILLVVGIALFAQSAVLVKDLTIQRNQNIWADMEAKVRAAGETHFDHLDPEDIADRLVEAIIQMESGGNPELVGSAGERGLMQLMPGTWEDMTARTFGRSLPFNQAFDAALNEEMGRAYLAYLQGFLHQHQAQWRADERALLLAAYNAGPAGLQRAGFDINRLPASVRDYVQRGSNLHDFLLAEQAQYVRHLLVGQLNRVPQDG